MNLNMWIKDTRINNGLSSTEMAERLEIEISTLSKIESGARQVDGQTLYKFLTSFNLQFGNPEAATVVIKSTINNEHVDTLLKTLNDIMKQFPMAKEQPFKNNPLKELVVDKLPNLFQKGFSLTPDLYKITGSIGKGQFAEVPWLCVFLNDITKTATKGYYIVLLFSADAQSVYMSLNQGWTYYQEKYGTKLARTKIQIAAKYLAENLLIADDSWITGSIDLKARGILAKGYEIGNIYAKEYEVNHLPTTEQFIKDFEQLLSLYNEINSLKGKRSVDEFTEELLLREDQEFFEEDEDFNYFVQDSLNLVETEDANEIKNDEPTKARKPVKQKNGKEKYTRRAIISAISLKEAEFKCELDSTHKTFTNKSTGKPYVEAHHLIPISKQADFEYELDCISNIVALCPNCHRLLHHGSNEEKEVYIEMLHKRFSDKLSESKIYIPLPELKKMYSL